MPGTDIAYSAISLRARYAMPGTNIVCGGNSGMFIAVSVRARDVMPGTDVMYAAIRWAARWAWNF
eukprot:1732496-Rhodomonas_salina.2